MLAGSETLSKHGSHGGPLSDLYPSRGHACPINHLETCWQGASHSLNMAAMVVHCLISTHQEDMHALSTTWRHAGKERDTHQKHGSHGGPLSDSLYYNLTTTNHEDIHALSTTWRHAGQRYRLSHVNRQFLFILDLVKMECNFLQYNEENLIFIFFT